MERVAETRALAPLPFQPASDPMNEAAQPRREPLRANITPEDNAEQMATAHRSWRRLFLDTLAETSNVSEAARIAGVRPARPYKLRRNDPEFARQWNAALLEGYEHLELETLHRLRAGTGKDDPKFDIANALRLLALHKDAVARTRALRDDEDEEAILTSLDTKIEQMRAREMAAAALLADTGTSTDDAA